MDIPYDGTIVVLHGIRSDQLEEPYVMACQLTDTNLQLKDEGVGMDGMQVSHKIQQ
jgi:hypothetical protein